MASFFSSMVSDFKSGFTGPEARNYGDGYDYKTPREKRYDAARKVEADQLRNKEDDKPHSQMAKPIYAPPPPKTVEQFYAELSNKANWGPLPSLGMASSGNKNKPSYKDVELREGGEVRSLFQPYG